MRSPDETGEIQTAPDADDAYAGLLLLDSDLAPAMRAAEKTITRFVPGVLQDRLAALIETLGAKPSVALLVGFSALSRRILTAIGKRPGRDLVQSVGCLLSVKCIQLGQFFFLSAFSLRCLTYGIRQSRHLALVAERDRLQAQQVLIHPHQRRLDVPRHLGAQRIAQQLYARLRRLVGRG